MTTFDELIAPVMPIIQQIEQDRPKHHNEDFTWSAFVQTLVYFFTKDLSSGNELVVSLQSADSKLGLPKTSRRALSEGFWRFSPRLLQKALMTYLATSTYPEIPELSFIGPTYAVDGSLFPLIQSIYWPRTRDIVKNVKLHLKFSLTSAIAVEFVLDDEHSSERTAHTMHGVHIITHHPSGIQNFFYALLLTALLHLHFKQRCLAEEGHYPPDHQSIQHETNERMVQTSDDTGRPTNHLAIARFFARLNDTLTRFWKISKHWLHTLADCLSRPFTSDVIRLLNKYAV